MRIVFLRSSTSLHSIALFNVIRINSSKSRPRKQQQHNNDNTTDINTQQKTSAFLNPSKFPKLNVWMTPIGPIGSIASNSRLVSSHINCNLSHNNQQPHVTLRKHTRTLRCNPSNIGCRCRASAAFCCTAVRSSRFAVCSSIESVGDVIC